MSLSERSLCVVIHDVAPATWDACRWLLDTLAQCGISRTTLLAVPRYHGLPRSAGFERWLHARAGAGDEVALHGFDHLDSGTPRGPIDRLRRRVYTRGEGEFIDLAFDTATQRIDAGRRWLADLGLTPSGFVAPAWLLGPAAWSALRMLSFDYTCTLRRLYLLNPHSGSERSVVCQSQVYSNATPLRQHLSVAWNEALAARQRLNPVVRLELHPTDDVAVVRRSWERLVLRQAATRRIRTLAEVAEIFRAAPVRAEP